MADNWYLILELEFDPRPVEDDAVIIKRIEEKAQFWSSNFNHFKYGPEYRRYHQLLPEIRKDMANSEKRRQLIHEACAGVYGPVDQKLKILGRNRDIQAEEIKRIADSMAKSGVTEEMVKSRIRKLGMKIAAVTVDYQGVYDKYYKNKPQNAAVFDGIKPLLDSFSAANLYEFLFKGTNADKLPCKDLLQKAKEMKADYDKTNKSINGSGSKLCGQCELTFKDEKGKAVYDEYLEYRKRKTILDEVKEIARISINNELTPDQGNEYIKELTKLFKDKARAEELLLAFCKTEKIFYNPQSGGTAKNDAVKICGRCGAINDTGDGRKQCRNCGQNLVIKCPACGVENDSNIKVCTCGFKFENIDKAIALCEQADYAVADMNFAVAELHLKEAEAHWSGYGKIKELYARLEEHKKRAGTVIEALRKSALEKRYYDAKRQYEAVQKSYSGFHDADLEEEINTAVNQAKTFFARAQTAPSKPDLIKNCVKAFEICKDLPGIRDLLAKNPPPKPTELNVLCDGAMRTNVLSWTPAQVDSSIFYSVVRKKDAVPVNIQDGELLGRVSVCAFNDKTILPGAPYFYAVFAEWAGVYSDPLQTKTPALNLFEIAGVRVSGSNAVLHFEWDAVPPGSSVEIFRIDGGREDALQCNSPFSFTESGLVNDRQYRYRVRLAYIIDGRKQATPGVLVSGIPSSPPLPVEEFEIKPQKNDRYQAVWINPNKENVTLYCAEKNPPFNPGDTVPLNALEKDMRKLPLQTARLTGAVFQYSKEDVLFICPVVIKSGAAVIGTIRRISNRESVRIQDVKIVNNRINIYIDPPKNANGFIVLYRFDCFPKDINDKNASRKFIPVRQYLHDGVLVIDQIEKKNYFFSVFAEFYAGTEKDYSGGADYRFDNAAKETITYSVSVSKKLIGESRVILEFNADSPACMLPDIEIYSDTGKTPMFKASSNLFCEIPSRQINGGFQVSFPIPKNLLRDTHIKAFFKDDADYAKNQLRLKTGSENRIN
ncbi:MAG: zinc ribbon domain-containing protein [Treponema sp.]|nr:zinc ribbon domain-containing protein [Treponema sp.]